MNIVTNSRGKIKVLQGSTEPGNREHFTTVSQGCAASDTLRFNSVCNLAHGIWFPLTLDHHPQQLTQVTLAMTSHLQAFALPVGPSF